MFFLLLSVCSRASVPTETAAPSMLAVASVTADTMVVRGRGLAERMLPVATSVATVIDLDREAVGTDLAELLARVAGLQVRRYGGVGAQAVPSLRGSSGAQVAVLMDGLPLVDAQRGAIDIALLPLERFDMVEVHRGLVPTRFGGIGAAGAVNLRSRGHAAGTGVRLFGGSFGDVGGRVSHGFGSRDGRQRGLVLAHARRVDNRFDFEPRIPASQVDLYPDTTWTRDNADFAEWGWYGQGELTGGAGLIRVAAGGFRRDGGRPGPFNLPSPHARVRHQRLDARLGYANAARDLTVDVLVANRHDRLHDEYREVGGDPAGTNLADSEDAVGKICWAPRWRPDMTWRALRGSSLGFTVGGDWRAQWYRESIAGAKRPQRNRHTVSAFAATSLNLTSIGLRIDPAWRWQRQRDDFPPEPDVPWLPEELGVVHESEVVSPALGVNWEIVPDVAMIYGHWHESARQPTWVELFGQMGGLRGNRELVAEELTGRDIGLRLASERWGGVVRATWFDQVVANAIVWRAVSLGFSEPYNTGRTRTRGYELETALERGPVTCQLAVTRQDARDRSGSGSTYHGKRIPFLSEWDTRADLRWRQRNWQAGLAITTRSDSFTDPYNAEDGRVLGRTLVDFSLARTWREGIWGAGREATFTAALMNIGNRVDHDVEGYPLPGRSLRLALNWH